MAKDLGLKFDLVLETDSSSAKSVAQRRGVAKIRHLHTPLLWLQRRISDGAMKCFKVEGKINEADIGTKALTHEALTSIMQRLDFEFVQGASSHALQASVPEAIASLISARSRRMHVYYKRL